MNKTLVKGIKPMLKDPYSLDILTEAMLRQEQVDIPVKHLLMPGMYSREIFMPAGSLLVGYAHPNDFMEVMITGKVLMFSDDSETEITAPFSRIAKAGKRKCGYVVEDTIWITYHPVKATTIEEAEDETLDRVNHYAEDSRNDYLSMLDEDGLSEEDIQTQMDYTAVLEVLGKDYYLSNSPIHGKGLFVPGFVSGGQVLGYALFEGMKTTLGRYINHSHYPNSEIVKLSNGNVEIRTLRGLFMGEEITINYRKRNITCLV